MGPTHGRARSLQVSKASNRARSVDNPVNLSANVELPQVPTLRPLDLTDGVNLGLPDFTNIEPINESSILDCIVESLEPVHCVVKGPLKGLFRHQVSLTSVHATLGALCIPLLSRTERVFLQWLESPLWEVFEQVFDADVNGSTLREPNSKAYAGPERSGTRTSSGSRSKSRVCLGKCGSYPTTHWRW